MTLWKVCRVKDVQTARLCADLGADMIGLHAIHGLPKSRMRVFRRIVTELRTYYPYTKPVLVTKIPSVVTLSRIMKEVGLNYLQLHKSITTEAAKDLLEGIEDKNEITVKYIAVISAQDPPTIAQIRKLKQIATYVLVDTSWRGGTGELAPRQKVRAILGVIGPEKALVGGGLSVQNVSKVIAAYRPLGIDVQSRLEVATRGRPKDSSLLIRFSKLVKGRSYTHRYLTPPRPLVSVAMTMVPEDETLAKIRLFSHTDVDLVHLDHSDGSVAPKFISSPIQIARQLRRLAPCLPYDLHLFVRGSSRSRDIVIDYLQANPFLRVCFFHCEDPGDASVSNFGSFFRSASELGFGPGMVFHSTKFDTSTLTSALSILVCYPVVDISLVTRSSTHPIDEIKNHDLPLLKLIVSHRGKNSSYVHHSIDRDISLEKARILSLARPSHVIVGSELLHSERPQTLIRQLRDLLTSPAVSADVRGSDEA